MARRPAQAIRQERARRTARITGLAGFLAAASLPGLLWHRAIARVASDFRLELDYLVTGWTGYALIAGGLLLLLPVAATSGWRPERRPRRRNAYLAWGVSLYLLGAVLATQVAAVVGS
jgi:MFS family permease